VLLKAGNLLKRLKNTAFVAKREAKTALCVYRSVNRYKLQAVCCVVVAAYWRL
jgi:hypothetical protein